MTKEPAVCQRMETISSLFRNDTEAQLMSVMSRSTPM